MDFYIVIPAHNEAAYLEACLESLMHQTHLPKKLVVVNDNSTDRTLEIAQQYAAKYDIISVINKVSSNDHLPGAKIVNAFHKGYEQLDSNYDVICKFDADLIFPNHYLEALSKHYEKENIGMAAGYCYVQQENDWVLESKTGKKHIRGALKSYRKACFETIGGLKSSMGWDTIDELIAQYYGWDLALDESLHVKHLRPTGKTYSRKARLLQGASLYKMRLGMRCAMLRVLREISRGRFSLAWSLLFGFLKAKMEKQEFILNEDQGRYFREQQMKALKNILS